MYDIIIIGAGPAGLTAAIYARRASKKVLVLEAKTYGGQIINTLDIENYPVEEHISGFDFATKIYNQAKNLGAEITFERAVEIKNLGNEKEVKTLKNIYKAKAVIIATGSENRKLGLSNEDELVGKGVSYCATCDGAFYKNKKVAVIGGGNTALEEASYLSDIAQTVYIIHRRDEFRAEELLVSHLKEKDNIEFIYNSNITKINANNKLESIEVTNNDGTISSIDIDGLFIAVGRIPENQNFGKLINLDKAGYVVANDGTVSLATYTVTWNNGTETPEIDTNVEYGTAPSYNGSTPTKDATTQYTYAFAWWKVDWADDNTAVAADQLPTVWWDVTYVAVFTPTLRSYTITFVDGAWTTEMEVAYGETPSHVIATKQADATCNEYAAWTWNTAIVPVEWNATYTATYACTTCVANYHVENWVCVADTEPVEELMIPSAWTTISWDDVPAWASLTGAVTVDSTGDVSNAFWSGTDWVVIQQLTGGEALEENNIANESALNNVLSQLVSSGTASMKWIVDIQLIYITTTWAEVPLWHVNFSKPVRVLIPVGAWLTGVHVRADHGSGYGVVWLTRNIGGNVWCNVDGTVDAADAYTWWDVPVVNGKAAIWTCGASSFVAYAEVPASTPTWWGGWGWGGSTSYSCKNLPANAVANNKTTPKSNTDYSYSTNTGAVCTFQCKTGYVRNETAWTCDLSGSTTSTWTNTEVNSGSTNENPDNANNTTVQTPAYDDELVNAYNWAHKLGITTMPTIQEAMLYSNITREQLAKMMVVFTSKVLGKQPVKSDLPGYWDVSAESRWA